MCADPKRKSNMYSRKERSNRDTDTQSVRKMSWESERAREKKEKKRNEPSNNNNNKNERGTTHNTCMYSIL